MHVTILITKGQGKARKVSLELPVIIGRAPEVGLSIAHPAVSRQHCEITEAAGFVKVRDLGSTNGTRVGNKKVPEAILRPHGKFSIGPLTFQVDYHYVGEATQYLGDLDEDEADDVDGIRGGSPAEQESSASRPDDDWGESEDVYGLAIESDAPNEPAEATPPPKDVPKMSPVAHKPKEPRRGDFMRTAKSPQKRLPDAPTPAPEKGYNLRQEPTPESAAGDTPRAATPPRKQPAASPAAPAVDRPFDLERELDEMLDGLQGLDLNEFLKGIM